MRVFAIGDVHLSFATDNKSMDVFGSRWEAHTKRLKEAWQDTVCSDDLVLIPGDISWAMYLDDAKADLAFLDSLNGTKVLLRGNHDYWWSSYTKVKESLPNSIIAVQNNVVRFGDIAVGGTRGWTSPECAGFSQADDRKIYEREKMRLELSLSKMTADSINIVMLHYPPFSEKGQPTEFVDIIEHRPISHVVYGHLHGSAHRSAFTGVRNGISYELVSADYLNFMPKRIL
ncbi:MAG: metallophosphoesterase [Eubacteriales bacterium]|nr:metallophosphoesterase [Eubacteriales bacterium]